MPSSQGPLLPRRRIGAELRRLRGTRTLDEVAAETLISTSKLSRLENGQGAPQPRDIRDLITFYGADKVTAERIRRWAADGRRQAWWREFSDVVPSSMDVYLDYESGASVIRTYSTMVLPGLLQTDAYSRRLLTTLYPQWRPDRVAKLVQLRQQRQKLLLAEDDDAPRLYAVIDEAAVRRALAMDPEGSGCEQLEHVVATSRHRNVSVRVLRLDVGLHAGLMGNFTVFQFAEDIDRDVVSVENHYGDGYFEEQSSVLEYLRLFDTLHHRALDEAQTREMLAELTACTPVSNGAPPASNDAPPVSKE